MHILFAENHTVFAKTVIAQFLAAHEVSVAPSLADARRRLSERFFDVLLIDYDLDDGKGDELVRDRESRLVTRAPHPYELPPDVASRLRCRGSDGIWSLSCAVATEQDPRLGERRGLPLRWHLPIGARGNRQVA